MTAWLSFDDFSGLVGNRFEVITGDHQTLALTLAETTLSDEPGGVGPDGVPRHQFSLLFDGPAQPTLGQAIWPLHHEGLGRLELFLVPVGAGPDGAMRYEAAFA